MGPWLLPQHLPLPSAVTSRVKDTHFTSIIPPAALLFTLPSIQYCTQVLTHTGST